MEAISISEWHKLSKQDKENIRILRHFKSPIPHKPGYWQIWAYSEYKGIKGGLNED